MLEAITPKPALQVEGEDARIDNRYFPFSISQDWVLICGKECSRMTEYAATRSGRSSTSGMPKIVWDKWRRPTVDYDDYDIMLSTSCRQSGYKSLDDDIPRETSRGSLCINDGERVLYCRKGRFGKISDIIKEKRV